MAASGRTWRVAIVGGAIIFGICLGAMWILLGAQSRRISPAIAAQHLAHARTLAQAIALHWNDADNDAIRRLVQSAAVGGAEVIVTSADGRIRVDSRRTAQREPPVVPELRDVLKTGSAVDLRPWTPGEPPYLVAVARVENGDAAAGAVWLAQPYPLVSGDSAAAWEQGTLASGLAAAITLMCMVLVLQVRRRVLRRAIDAARALSEGDLAAPQRVDDDDELAPLSAAMQTLRARMSGHLGLIDRQRQMLESLVHQLREGVVVARRDGRIALINPTAIRLLNLATGTNDEESCVGKPVEQCIPQLAVQKLLSGPLLPGEREEPDGAIRDATGSADMIVRLEVQGRRGLLHLLARASEVVLADTAAAASDGALGRVVVLTDITELQRAVQVRTDFVANASHELRTPLSTIRAAVETLLSMDLKTEAPAAQQFLSKIDRQSVRLQQLVSDLLDLSRLESPTERFAAEVIECRRILQEATARFADARERKGVHWEARVEPPDAVHMAVNPQLLRLIVDNLVDNAIKYTDPGGRVTLTIRVARDAVEIDVADTGWGIPPEDRERVFERFYQVQRSRTGTHERGTGLGLSIVRHAVSAMGGSIQLASEVAKGTTVTVRIPQNVTVLS